MYQIVVVDDKKSIREGLKKHVPWEKLGYELIETASSAQEAIQLIETNCVDVLLTDIVMPDMTGLELIYFAKLINPDIKVVILSAYDRFDYAQKAIQLGAYCYLTKPVDLAELQKELLAIKQLLNDEAAARRQNKLFMDVAREQFFSQVLSQHWKSDQEIRDRAAQLQLSFQTGKFVILAAEVSPTQLSAPMIWEQILDPLKQAGELFCLETKEKSIAILLFPKIGNLEEFLCEFCDALKDEKLSIGISNPYLDLSMISLACQEAQKALEYRVMGKESTVFFYDKIIPLFQKSGELSSKDEEKLIQRLSEGKQESFKQHVRQIIKEKTAQAYPDAPNDIYLTLICFLNHYMERSFGMIEQDLEEVQQLIRNVMSSSLEQTTQKLMEYIDHCFSRLQSDNRKVSNQIVERAMAYIREHYSEDITLNKLSQEVFVNPMYLSRLFKEKAGVSYIDYLTEVRIWNAKQLLNNLSLRIYDISEMVGYESRKHFGKIFKEHTGLSPKEYRNSISE